MKNLMQAILILCSAVLASCKGSYNEEYQQAYSVLTVTSDSVEIMEAYSASIRGQQDIEIYPQVSGTISRLCIQEGQKVRKGETLFVIDQVPYKAALRTALANVHAAQAQVETAQLDYNSKKELYRENVISEYELSTARNALAIAKAGLEQAEAQETDARNSLSYTEVKSPSDGIVGTLPYRTGALVSSSMGQPLTTVSDNSTMYVYFSMTENQLRALIRQYGSPDETIRQMPSIRLQLNDGTMYDVPGRIESISGIINTQTGTVSIRSVFPNEKRLLFSGGIGNIIIPRTEPDAVVIPQAATYELQDKIFAYKVQEGKAVAAPIKVEPLNNGNEYMVRSGLQPGDVIVSEGVGLLQDGMEITLKGTDH
ncbi:efflux RND transporter periplasmic adaptor subunit [Bacteroides oleiciplenus]|uniref:Efflux RND transporter periplasmic adaptor subunit n=1 Tax=Bacteroides oleiciplenus TaxID=626931 RepID=A0A3E5AZV2_9BACE|nr:efflux RND transporter periplasmic adaptor subunit [Bacteroides oleiciplenus]RGN30848.1 efflux RND transporter periplasmic adaptor subunit [Bacteroides oleiciplenus]